ncbi:unnamed protein product [Prorocentrum cordatum]|uniref:Coiled-coil domain-containing protein 153 n=1 Tax=Prorocentrum cordatum TaxID=2364126 RepID=A0ABN9RZ00_9DINO|nr:unnamed protein product [Polarella glacialis]
MLARTVGSITQILLGTVVPAPTEWAPEANFYNRKSFQQTTPLGSSFSNAFVLSAAHARTHAQSVGTVGSRPVDAAAPPAREFKAERRKRPETSRYRVACVAAEGTRSLSCRCLPPSLTSVAAAATPEESSNAQFQPNSIQGQKLLQKCKHLLEENSELGRQLGEERVQMLRIQLTVERRKRLQLRQRIGEFDQHAEQVDAENERMQRKIAELGQQLKETRAEIDRHKKDIEEFRSGTKRKREDRAPAGAPAELPAPAPVAPEKQKKSKKHKADK